jgi:hypothetical protein
MRIRADLDDELSATHAPPCHSIGELAANMPLLTGSRTDGVFTSRPERNSLVPDHPIDRRELGRFRHDSFGTPTP